MWCVRRGRFFFVHLKKTAGTTLRKRMQHHFGEAAVYPGPSDGIDRVESYFSIAHLQERMRVRGDEIQAVTGHFPLCTVDALEGDFTTLTILREPIERTISYLRHQREWTAEDRHKRLEEIYSDPELFDGHVHNHMVKMFSLTPDEATARIDAGHGRSPWMLTRVEFTPERLDRAKAKLASVDAIGLQEHFDEFCQELARRFGWKLGPPEQLMQGEPIATRQAEVEVSDGFRSRIAEDNALDIELYEFGRRLYERRRAGRASSRSGISTTLGV
jgi:hypothetical protein